MNNDQTKALVASYDRCFWLNFTNDKFENLGEMYEIGQIQCLCHDAEERVFYLMANKYLGKLGLFLIRINDDDPTDYRFEMKFTNKLDIEDADMFIIKDEERKFKEILISFKTIYMNTYTVQVFDLST